MRQSDVLRLRCGKCDLRLKLAAPDDGAAGVQDGVAGLRLGGAWIFAGGRVMPVTTKVGISVSFKNLVTFGIHHDSVIPRGLEILNQVGYCVSV